MYVRPVKDAIKKVYLSENVMITLRKQNEKLPVVSYSAALHPLHYLLLNFLLVHHVALSIVTQYRASPPRSR
jgi:hypothetical protein